MPLGVSSVSTCAAQGRVDVPDGVAGKAAAAAGQRSTASCGPEGRQEGSAASSRSVPEARFCSTCSQSEKTAQAVAVPHSCPWQSHLQKTRLFC